MATFIKINDFVEDLVDGLHDFDAHTFKIALSNTAPAVESTDPRSDGNGVIANVTQISYTNYSDDLAVDRTLESITTILSSGTVTVDAADFTITASGGALPDFQYVYIYNDTATGDPIVCVFNQGSAISLSDGETCTVSFNASGWFTVV